MLIHCLGTPVRGDPRPHAPAPLSDKSSFSSYLSGHFAGRPSFSAPLTEDACAVQPQPPALLSEYHAVKSLGHNPSPLSTVSLWVCTSPLQASHLLIGKWRQENSEIVNGKFLMQCLAYSRRSVEYYFSLLSGLSILLASLLWSKLITLWCPTLTLLPF